MVRINGTDQDAAGMTLTEYLAQANYDPRRIAIARNDEIVPKAQFDEVVLRDGDIVEIVTFMGGGSGRSAAGKSE